MAPDRQASWAVLKGVVWMHQLYLWRGAKQVFAYNVFKLEHDWVESTKGHPTIAFQQVMGDLHGLNWSLAKYGCLHVDPGNPTMAAVSLWCAC